MARFVFGLSDEIEGEVSHDGHVVSAVPYPEAREILFEGDVEDPMDTVLDAPMARHRVGESLGRKRARGDVVTPLEADLLSLLDLGFDHADDGQLRKAPCAGKGAIRIHPADRPGDLVLRISKRPWALSRLWAMSSSGLGALAK